MILLHILNTFSWIPLYPLVQQFSCLWSNAYIWHIKLHDLGSGLPLKLRFWKRVHKKLHKLESCKIRKVKQRQRWDSWDSNSSRIQGENYSYEKADNGKNEKYKPGNWTILKQQYWASTDIEHWPIPESNTGQHLLSEA